MVWIRGMTLDEAMGDVRTTGRKPRRDRPVIQTIRAGLDIKKRSVIRNAIFALLGSIVLTCAFDTREAQAQTETQAQTRERPIQIALFHPVQIFAEDTSIRGLRVNVIYGRNVSVKGLDVGLVNHNTGGISKGLQWGLVGVVESDFAGWQNNLVNLVKGQFIGYQSGYYNDFDNGEAFQLGIVNKARDMKGFQLGLVNYTENMHGLQIGLLNIIKNKDKLPVFPIVNWSF